MEIDVPTVVSAFLTQVGARHISFDFTDAQKRLIAHPMMQGLILFAMFFFSTRRLSVAVILLACYYLAVTVLFNETHHLNLFSRKWLATEGLAVMPEKSAVDIYRENVSKLAAAT